MKIALLQTRPAHLDRARNVDRLVAAVERHEADLFIAPELATTGYLFADRAQCLAHAEPVPGPAVDALVAVAARRGARVVCGLAERRDERLYNSAVYVDGDGVVGVYRKVHLFDREKEIFDPGDEPFRVWPLGEHRLGLMICLDWLFPEAARTLALAGADLVAHPSNLVLSFGQAAMVTRALENGVFAATANRVGTERLAAETLTFTGASQIVDPAGRLLARAGADTEEVVVADVDLAAARDKAITARNDRLADRRPDCYRL